MLLSPFVTSEVALYVVEVVSHVSFTVYCLPSVTGDTVYINSFPFTFQPLPGLPGSRITVSIVFPSESITSNVIVPISLKDAPEGRTIVFLISSEPVVGVGFFV